MKVLTGMVVLVAVVATSVAAPAAADARTAVEPVQKIVVLFKAHSVFAKPTARRRSGTIGASRPITRGQAALPVIGRTTTKDGGLWFKVMLPGRPNGRKGWIGRSGTALTSTNWHIVVRTSSRRALVYLKGRLVRSFGAIVGKPSTPTPHGEFFIEENVRMPSGAPGAPFALALSARSNVLQEFEGGPGQIAIHGIANLGGTIGTAVSHGCVRLSNGNVTWLAARVPPGAPVTIRS